jgi:NADH-quinone oxidoreductase subunit A
MTALVGYLILFLGLGVGFVFVHLVAGKQIRPAKPDAEKLTIYECGEPTIGSAWIQFDLRFYVVALLFVIFDVEVAFFFPWAVVFGQANTMANTSLPIEQRAEAYLNLATPDPRDQAEATKIRAWLADGSPEALGKIKTALDEDKKDPQFALSDLGEEPVARRANRFAWFALFDIIVFFGVLLVGFAYLWRRGDLVWVRSTAAERVAVAAPDGVPAPARSEVLVGAGSGH